MNIYCEDVALNCQLDDREQFLLISFLFVLSFKFLNGVCINSFPTVVIKCMTKAAYRRKSLLGLKFPEGLSPSWQKRDSRHCCWNSSWGSHLEQQTWSRVNELTMVWVFSLSKPASSDKRPIRPHLPRLPRHCHQLGNLLFKCPTRAGYLIQTKTVPLFA